MIQRIVLKIREEINEIHSDFSQISFQSLSLDTADIVFT